MLARRLGQTSQRFLLHTRCQQSWRLHRSRSYSSSTPHPPAQNSSNPSVLAGIEAELDRIAPRIDVHAYQIEVLDSPAQFYETLKRKILAAKRRIYLSTLYIGKSEHELVATLRQALINRGPDLKVSILTDALRGTRESPEPSSASLLATLAAEFPTQVEIRMYHTPNLTGLRKRLVPPRINEGWGLQHMKLYGFDNDVILSGANLSNDYFTNRQDRYHVFSSKRVTEYFARIHHAVCSVSFLLLPTPTSYTLTWPDSNPAPSPLLDPQAYRKAITALLLPLASPSSSLSPKTAPEKNTTNTSIYPLFSIPPTLNTELPALRTLLFPSQNNASKTPQIHSYTFTAGYFNPHPLITSALIARCLPPNPNSNLTTPATITSGTILTASPFANGFYNSTGISGLLPAAYTHLALTFLRAARGANIQLREWQHGTVGELGGWTYHAKGLWLTFALPLPPSPSSPISNSHPNPTITSLGSSNYTTRSYSLDLEAGALVLTHDARLAAAWEHERMGLLARSGPVDEAELGREGRRAGWRVRAAMWVVGILGGAL